MGTRTKKVKRDVKADPVHFHLDPITCAKNLKGV
jgi:hypothetical protein